MEYLKPYNYVQIICARLDCLKPCNCEQIICIRLEYLKPCNCVLIICIRLEYLKPCIYVQIICIRLEYLKPNKSIQTICIRLEYLKPCNWEQTVCIRNTWNNPTVSELFLLDWNTWNYTILCKLFVSSFHHVVSQARISLTISRHFSLSFITSGRSSGPHLVSSHSCWMYVRAGRPAFTRPYVRVHRSTSLMSSSLLPQQWPAYLVRLTWIVFVMGGRWPYSWCLVGCCRQDLFNIARSILV